jgi:hypothetical protein
MRHCWPFSQQTPLIVCLILSSYVLYCYIHINVVLSFRHNYSHIWCQSIFILFLLYSTLVKLGMQIGLPWKHQSPLSQQLFSTHDSIKNVWWQFSELFPCSKICATEIFFSCDIFLFVQWKQVYQITIVKQLSVSLLNCNKGLFWKETSQWSLPWNISALICFNVIFEYHVQFLVSLMLWHLLPPLPQQHPHKILCQVHAATHFLMFGVPFIFIFLQ